MRLPCPDCGNFFSHTDVCRYHNDRFCAVCGSYHAAIKVGSMEVLPCPRVPDSHPGFMFDSKKWERACMSESDRCIADLEKRLAVAQGEREDALTDLAEAMDVLRVGKQKTSALVKRVFRDQDDGDMQLREVCDWLGETFPGEEAASV